MLTSRLVRLSMLSAAAALVACIAAAIGVSMAMSKRIVVVGATDAGRFIPAVSLDKPLLNDPRVQAYVEECLRASFSHDFRNYRRTMSAAYVCYTPKATDMFAVAMSPLLTDIAKRRMVMTPVIDQAPVIKRAFLNSKGQYTWELEATMILGREGTNERVPPAPYMVQISVTRAALEESVRGILISNLDLKPLT